MFFVKSVLDSFRKIFAMIPGEQVFVIDKF